MKISKSYEGRQDDNSIGYVVTIAGTEAEVEAKIDRLENMIAGTDWQLANCPTEEEENGKLVYTDWICTQYIQGSVAEMKKDFEEIYKIWKEEK